MYVLIWNFTLFFFNLLSITLGYLTDIFISDIIYDFLVSFLNIHS